MLIAGSVLAVVVAGLVVPGAGLIVAVVLAFTLLKNEGTTRWWIIGLGVFMLLLAAGVHSAPWTHPQVHVGSGSVTTTS